MEEWPPQLTGIFHTGGGMLKNRDPNWERPPFYTISQPIWTAPAPTSKPSFLDRLRQREGEQLAGKRTFDFSLTIPRDAKVEGGTGQGLLPSFMEQGARASVVYYLQVQIKRGTFGTDHG